MTVGASGHWLGTRTGAVAPPHLFRVFLTGVYGSKDVRYQQRTSFWYQAQLVFFNGFSSFLMKKVLSEAWCFWFEGQCQYYILIHYIIGVKSHIKFGYLFKISRRLKLIFEDLIILGKLWNTHIPPLLTAILHSFSIVYHYFLNSRQFINGVKKICRLLFLMWWFFILWH